MTSQARRPDQYFAVSAAQRAYVLGLLVVVGVFAWMDRNILAILLESIRSEFDLSDTELGLLGGLAFGLFYASVGLPVAWLADRYNRRSLIALALALWSAATVLCGFAIGFLTLFLARMWVGIGEAGASPPAQSLISDYFEPNRRGFALGIFYLFIPLGYVAGFLFGGWLNDYFDWRTAFIVVGCPGLVVALVVRYTLREPPRGLVDKTPDTGSTPTLGSTIRYIVRRESLRHLPLAGAVHSIGSVAAAVWLPSYFIREYQISSGEAGTAMALAYGLFGGVGVLTGGYFADWLVKRTADDRWYPRGCALVILAGVPAAMVLYLTDSLLVALSALCVMSLLTHMFLGPVTATMQNLAGVRRRAVVAAVYLFLVNLVSSLGPVFVGAISDFFSSSIGSESLKYSLLIVVVTTSVWSAVHFLWASRHVREDLSAVRRDSGRLEH